MVAREERRAKSADNEGGPVENNGGGGDWKTQPTLPGASKRMVRDGQPWFFHPPRRKWVLDTNRISATVSPAALSATPAIVPPETIAPMSPAPAENIPAINTVTGTLSTWTNDQGFHRIFIQGTRTLDHKGAAGQEAMTNMLATFE
jgi:hypothetical protein